MKGVVFAIISLFVVAVHSKSLNNEDNEYNYNSVIFNDDEEGDFDDFDEAAPSQEDTLLLVNVLFRHGNRTADSKAELYPKDPYYNYEYFPYGLGQLTKAGKAREYSIGTALRERYNKFLGEDYYPEIVDARSTNYNRTKMSLQLVLAGLFPPKKDEAFSEDQFAWQPVPYNYFPRTEDRVLLGNLCPNYIELYNKYISSPRMIKQFKLYENVFKYIAQYSGVNVKKFQEVYNMYFGISTETEFGLELPSWLSRVWPSRIIHMSIKEYFVSMGTTDMRKILAGYFLEKIIKDAKAKLAENKQNGRKIYLYSAHENNVAQILISLGVFKWHIPNYGAYAIIELHKIGGVPGFKILYENHTGGGPQLLRIPGCDTFCPFDQFVSLTQQYLPDGEDDDLCGN